jgi:hypothetical protein
VKSRGHSGGACGLYILTVHIVKKCPRPSSLLRLLLAKKYLNRKSRTLLAAVPASTAFIHNKRPSNLNLAKAPNQKIITVDVYCWNPWGLTPEAHEALAAQVLHYLVETGQVERVRMDKNEFFASYQGVAPALVFLDAWHDYEETKKDIEWARSAGARIIAGHDYCDEFPGVKQAVDEFGGPRELAGTAWLL